MFTIWDGGVKSKSFDNPEETIKEIKSWFDETYYTQTNLHEIWTAAVEAVQVPENTDIQSLQAYADALGRYAREQKSRYGGQGGEFQLFIELE